MRAGGLTDTVMCSTLATGSDLGRRLAGSHAVAAKDTLRARRLAHLRRARCSPKREQVNYECKTKPDDLAFRKRTNASPSSPAPSSREEGSGDASPTVKPYQFSRSGVVNGIEE